MFNTHWTHWGNRWCWTPVKPCSTVIYFICILLVRFNVFNRIVNWPPCVQRSLSGYCVRIDFHQSAPSSTEYHIAPCAMHSESSFTTFVRPFQFVQRHMKWHTVPVAFIINDEPEPVDLYRSAFRLMPSCCILLARQKLCMISASQSRSWVRRIQLIKKEAKALWWRRILVLLSAGLENARCKFFGSIGCRNLSKIIGIWP